ncbi:AbrB family transcriptional regulator [Bifidobacterium bombi]|uniref:AbrB family transcriptional regulator n=1 Tax=Bifidobacterium bombi DSM 19703 TaxID=1341695 RepID=A0A086BNZ9_9BIFI|nr:AbrB family transcriptional regulator [Bifidobacterium bombi]KFF30663.1 hypothetical protein BBOMB_1530 [Bifidobacterium bombi DSM 19703]
MDGSKIEGKDNEQDAQDSAAGVRDGSADDRSGSASEALTDSYERLRHSTDPVELSEFARRELPPRTDQAAFSRATALLEAVAGNPHTPLEDRIYLGEKMPFPNILVKLSEDDSPQVRIAVAANKSDKNWLVGRLTKDRDGDVREAALHNPQTSWKMRLEGAQDVRTSAETLDFLALMGVESYQDAPAILTCMVRRAVASNPTACEQTLHRLSADPSAVVANIARTRLGEDGLSGRQTAQGAC